MSNTINIKGVNVRKSGNRVILEIPQGMTGKGLEAWKQSNRQELAAAKLELLASEKPEECDTRGPE